MAAEDWAATGFHCTTAGLNYRPIIGICIAFVAVGVFMWLSGLLTPMTINDISLSVELQANDICGTNGETTLSGKGIPCDKGNYRCKIFFGDRLEAERTEDMYVVCVHKGSNFLGDKSWVKVFRVLNAL